MKPVWILLALNVGLAMPYAQERTAGGTLQNQASWSALQNLTEQANGNAKNAHIRLNKTEACAQRGMLYAPGRSGDGCIKALVDEAPLNQLKTQMNNILTCADQGRVFNGRSCSTGFMVTGGGQCLTPEGNGSVWTIRNAWGDATGCEGGAPRCSGSKVLHLGYGSDTLGENEMSNFCKYSGGNACHTQMFLCTQGI